VYNIARLHFINLDTSMNTMNLERLTLLILLGACSNGCTTPDIGTDGEETAANVDSGVSTQDSGLDTEDSGELDDDGQGNELRVLSLNAWRDGTGAASNASWAFHTQSLANLIRVSGADIIGYQEAMSEAPIAALAAELGFHYEYRGNSTYEAVLSRYPIVGTFDIPIGTYRGDWGSQGTEIRVSLGQTVVLVNSYQYWGDYGPYGVRDDHSISEEQLVADSKLNRADHMEFDVLPRISAYLEAGKPVFITGDFNEPSHLDWTEAVAEAGWNYGRSVEWQTSIVLADAGFVDSYREVVPIDTTNYDSRGETWVRHGIGYDPETEPLDRIDFVHYSGDSVVALDSEIVGEVLPTDEQEAHGVTIDIPLSFYQPDHRSVVSTFDMPMSIADSDMTALTFEGMVTNSDIPSNFGSNVSTPEPGIVSAGTPNVEVTWSAQNGAWQFYDDGEWSAAQMDQYEVNNPFDILFSSDEGWSVTVESFVFDDYANNESGNCFIWTLYEDSAEGLVIKSGVETTINGQNLTVFTGMTTPHSGTVLLRIVEHPSNVSSSVADQAIDSIVFSQTETQ